MHIAKRLPRSVLILALLIAPKGEAFTQDGGGGSVAIDFEAIQATKVAEAVQIETPIQLDGRLDESVWQEATPVGDFYQWQPNNGAPASEQTEVRFLFDDDNLYIGVRCFDLSIDELIVTELREDFSGVQSDGILVLIDSLHDRRSAFGFGTNPAGAKRDMQIMNNGGQLSFDWDGVWDVRASQDEQAWYAEFVIPFKTLRFTNASSQEWGLQMVRNIRHVNEESHWSPVPRRFRARISMAGTLRGLEGIRQGRNLKVKPYINASMADARDTGTSDVTRDYNYDGGFDVKYGLTPSITLDATYRTDFSQVEVDQQQTNLTRFNVFFAEKRDFFLENTGVFNFGTGTSRGRANLIPFYSRRIGLKCTRDNTGCTPVPILGGTRVTGKVGKYDIGFIAMKTESSDAAPSDSFIVGRVRRNMFQSSWIGALFTERDSTVAGDYNRLFGADLHLQFFQRLDLDGYVLKSQTPNMEGEDVAARFETAWREDDWDIRLEMDQIQGNFNPEVGFARRRDFTKYAGGAGWRPRLEGHPLIRNFVLSGTYEYFQDPEGEVESRNNDYTLGIAFQNSATLNLNIKNSFDRLDEETRISGALVPAGDYQYRAYELDLTTDRSRLISGSGNLGWGEFWNGHRNTYGGNIDLKPDHHLTLGLGLDRNVVKLPGQNFTTNLMSVRSLYAFTSRMFLNAFIQYNTTRDELTSNIRFNFTYRPLSDIYLVYNDRRDTLTGVLIERAFIIKVTNLFNF